jgi:hypothetical protein
VLRCQAARSGPGQEQRRAQRQQQMRGAEQGFQIGLEAKKQMPGHVPEAAHEKNQHT